MMLSQQSHVWRPITITLELREEADELLRGLRDPIRNSDTVCRIVKYLLDAGAS